MRMHLNPPKIQRADTVSALGAFQGAGFQFSVELTELQKND